MSREYLHDELPVDLREQLCAWMDGELPADQAAFLQRRLAHDPELRALWERWQLASACLRGQPLRLMPADMGECLVVQVQEATAPRRRHWPWAAGLAAAVLLAALLPRMTVMETPPALPESPRMAAEATPLAAPPRGPMSPVNDGPRAAEDVLQPRPWPRSPLAPGEREMEAYLVRHNALVGDQGLGGFMPYVDVVVHETDAQAETTADDAAETDTATEDERR